MKEPLHSRRIWKRLACLAAMLFCVAAAGVPALAQEAAGDSGSGQSGIPEEWAQVTQEAPMTAGDFSGMTLSDWLEKGAEILRESLHEPLRLLARLCGLLLLAAVGKSMCTERTSPELAGLVDTVVTLAVFTLCSSCMLALTGVLQDAIETSRVYIISFVPVFASVLTACGQVGGAALYSGFFFGAAMVMADILCRVGLPLTRVLLALNATAAVGSTLDLSQLTASVCRWTKWLLTFCATVFGALIGLQGMLEWEKLGYTVCGTARNGKLALELIEREKPDIVIADVKMPVMDGLTLARTCRERSALPAFIMLTSFEEFGYIKQAMGAGVVDYLVKLDLTPENLQTALAKAAEKVKKERALLGELSAQENLAESVRSYQERFFVRLYAGLFPDEAALEQPLQHMELNLASDAYLVASCEIIANTALTPAQQLKLSFSCGRMLETTLQNYLPCYVTGADAMRCNVLFCLTDAQCQNYRTVLRPLLERASQILYNYFTVRLLWAVGRPTGSLLGLARCCRENAHLQPLLTVEQPIQFVEVNEGDATAGKMQVVAQVQEYIQSHLSERLTLADVAAVFNFSPNYLSQLFGKYGDSGFVEYITETRIAAAKEMLEQGDLKVYEIAEKLGYESAFYFSKVFKKVTGLSPREYQQSI